MYTLNRAERDDQAISMSFTGRGTPSSWKLGMGTGFSDGTSPFLHNSKTFKARHTTISLEALLSSKLERHLSGLSETIPYFGAVGSYSPALPNIVSGRNEHQQVNVLVQISNPLSQPITAKDEISISNRVLDFGRMFCLKGKAARGFADLL